MIWTVLLKVSVEELVIVRLERAVPEPTAPVKPTVPLALMVKVLAPSVVPLTKKFELSPAEILVLLLSVTFPLMVRPPV